MCNINIQINTQIQQVKFINIGYFKRVNRRPKKIRIEIIRRDVDAKGFGCVRFNEN